MLNFHQEGSPASEPDGEVWPSVRDPGGSVVEDGPVANLEVPSLGL